MSQLRIAEVLEAGTPNRERIAIEALAPCDLSGYCVLIGLLHLDGTASPIKDNMLWFGHGAIAQGDWIFVYTGPGQTTVTPIVNSPNKLYSIFWGKDKTVFQNRAITPMICQLNVASLLAQPEAKPQALLTNQTNIWL